MFYSASIHDKSLQCTRALSHSTFGYGLTGTACILETEHVLLTNQRAQNKHAKEVIAYYSMSEDAFLIH